MKKILIMRLIKKGRINLKITTDKKEKVKICCWNTQYFFEQYYIFNKKKNKKILEKAFFTNKSSNGII